MTQSRRGQWPVVALNGVVAGTVLVLVAVLALVVKPPAPPGIAAFAPQAAKPITKAPQSQSARYGTGAGQCSTGQTCVLRSPTPSPSGTIQSIASPLTGPAPPGLQCYTWPDGTVTQTFDRQSPPCISRWDNHAGNGGNTSPGVTGTEIRVALPITSTSALATWPGLKPIVDFFNTHFQFYGRQIKIVQFDSQQATEQTSSNNGAGVNDPSAQHADAQAITAQHVFATTDFVDPLPYAGSLPTFRDVLTQHKIISLAGGASPPFATAGDLASHAPYEWSYYPTMDSLMSNLATMTCRQLVGRPAKHAQDPNLAKTIRKFALVFPTDAELGGPPPGLNSMLHILDGCGVHSPKVVRYDVQNDSILPLSSDFQTLHSDGVTSLIFFPYTGSQTQSSPMTIANNVGYTPEWIMPGWNKYLTDIWLAGPASETRAAFGVAPWNKMPQLPLEPWYEAYLQGGGSSSSTAGLYDGLAFYNEMLQLASGIQMAGPRLTPASFAQGLASTTFPNPGAANAPDYQGTVGFASGDPVMINDYTGFWLDTTASDTYVTHSPDLNDDQATCYVGLGRRWSLDTWPTIDDFESPNSCR